MSFNFHKVPRTVDGRQIFLPSTIADDQDVQFTGSGDDIENGTRFEGVKFYKKLTSAGSAEVEFQFIEQVDLNGGGFYAKDCELGDYVHYEIYAPATIAASTVGNVDKFNLGGPYNMFVPASPGEGSYNIDLEETLNSNVDFTKAVPVPANGSGYFDMESESDPITINYSGTGAYNLFDFSMVLTRVINYYHVVGSEVQASHVVPASYGAKQLLPHYKHKITINRTSETTDLQVTWWLFLGRECTQP